MFSDPTAIENLQFRDPSLAVSWIQADDLLFETPANAPLAPWNFDVLNDGGTFSLTGTLDLPTPTNLVITYGGDGWAIFTDPDGVHFWETWGAAYNAASGTYSVSYLVKGDLTGTGWGLNGVGAGIRAAGASLLGGLILPEELDNLSIEHALPIELDDAQLKAGTVQTDQFIAPAVSADADSIAMYGGTIPIGAHFALPSDLDISHAGLTPEGQALAKAYQEYGGYVVDAAGFTTSLALVTGATAQQINNLSADAAWIRSNLVMIQAVPCFVRGTLIRAAAGEIPVENLAIGDLVVTDGGAAQPIRWIGRRGYDGRFIAGNRKALPIRIMAGALAGGVPARDLWLSPEHALYFNGVLAAAEHLVNGATIVQANSVDRVEYFNIEFDEQQVIFADGAAAESYVDCDNRLMFDNGAEYDGLYAIDERPTWCFLAPRPERDAPEVTAIRAALLTRAEALGHALDRDPDLHLIVDGAIVRPQSVAGRVYQFSVLAGSSAVWLASRSTVPAEVEPSAPDIRQLGIAVERIVLSGGGLTLEAVHGYAALRDGFHRDEATHRWTDGRACLPEAFLRPFADGFTVEVHLAESTLAYRLPPTPEADAAAA